GAETAPVAPLPPEPEGAKDALLAPALQPGQVDPARLPQIAPADDPGLTTVAPAVVPAPEAELPPKESAPTTIEAQVPTLPPVKGLVDQVPTGLGDVPGVEVNNLPHIGGVPKVEVAVDDERPVVQFARSFDGAAGKPLFVILLHDVGSAGMSRNELATLPFPVSFVIDPLATDATAASAAYRSAGQEVVTLANGIPAGAEASDLAETFQTLAGILPESVAVIDQDLGGFQDNRPMASMVLPILQDEGRGLVTYDRGLNAADQIARRDGVPAAVIFRRLDGEGENKSTIRRYLDRAAFKAAQEGAVVVIGDTRAETVAAILEWTVEGRASAVTLAPLTAVLRRK
ncbi:MAG: divergent polysaccharide deacetylase family protein, partial [Paracoccaceae bacterium]